MCHFYCDGISMYYTPCVYGVGRVHIMYCSTVELQVEWIFCCEW